MSYEQSIELIQTCLRTGGDNMEGYDNKDRDPNITIRDGGRYEVRKAYDLNISSVGVLAHFEWRSNESEWEGHFASYTIFKFDKGLGVAYNTGWWGPTFGEDQYDMDIQEDFDWKKFFNFVLTEELRDKLKEAGTNIDMDIAELILLTKECD